MAAQSPWVTRSVQPARCCLASQWSSWNAADCQLRWSLCASAQAWVPRRLSKGCDMELIHFKWQQDGDGIVTLSWDTPGKPVNVLSLAAVAELGQVADKIADASIKGLIITSAKSGNFCAGADLDEMASFAGAGETNAKAAFDAMMGIHRVFRKFETCGKPVVA